MDEKRVYRLDAEMEAVMNCVTKCDGCGQALGETGAFLVDGRQKEPVWWTKKVCEECFRAIKGAGVITVGEGEDAWTLKLKNVPCPP